MHDRNRGIEVIGDGQAAPRTAGRQDLRLGLLDIVHFAFRDLSRGLGMLHLEGAASAAAVIGPRELHIFDARDGFEDVPGLGADLLPLHQMAGIVIGDAELRTARLQLRQPLLVFVDEDGHILELGGQELRRPDLLVGHLLTELAQITEQMGVFVLERRTAGCAVDDDRVHVLAGKELQGIPDASGGMFPGPPT